MERPLIENMLFEGIESLPVKHGDNKSTVYVHNQIWAKAARGKEDGCAALRAAGMDEFVSEGFNTSTLSAFIREELRDGNELPPEIKEAFDITEVTSLRARKASNSVPTSREVASQSLKNQQ